MTPMRTMRELAGTECRRMLLSPWMWIGVALTAAYMIRQIDGNRVVFHRDSVFLATGLVPLAMFAYLAGFGMASLARRSRADDLLSTLPTSAQQRAGAILVAAALVPGAAAAAALAVTIAWASFTDAVGRPVVVELLCGVAAVVVAAVAGVTLGHRFGSIVAGIAPLIALVAAAMVLNGRGRARWLNLFVEFPSRNEVIDLARRVPWIHFAYLVVIAVTIAAAVVTIEPLRFVVFGVAVAGALGWLQLRPAGADDEARVRAFVTTFDRHECAVTGNVGVCLLPGFEGWRPEIEAELDRVLGAVPASPDREPQQLVVAQIVDAVPDEGYDPAFVRRVEVVEVADRVGTAIVLRKDVPIDASTLMGIAAWNAGLPASPSATFLPSDELIRGPDSYCSRSDGLAVAVGYLAVAGRDLGDELNEYTGDLVSPDGSAVSRVAVGGVMLSLEQAQLLGQLLVDDRPNLADRVAALVPGDVELDEIRDAAGIRRPDRIPRYPDHVSEPPRCR